MPRRIESLFHHCSRSGSTIVVAWLSLLAAQGLAQIPSRPSTPSTDTAEVERARVAALLRHSVQPGDAREILEEAFSGAVEALAAEVRSLRTDAGGRELAARIEQADLAAAARERLWRVLVRQLKAVGAGDSLELLDRLAGQSPTVLARVPGCRRPVDVAVFDFARAAQHSAFAVRLRLATREFDALSSRDRNDWILQGAAAGVSSPRCRAAVSCVRRLAPDDRQDLREELARAVDGQATLPASSAAILVETWLVDRIAPPGELFRRVPGSVGLDFLRRIGGLETASTFRARTLDVARGHSELASLAATLDAGDATTAALERDGASAALALSRDGTAEMTRALAAVLLDGDASSSVRRHAALALMHQRTATARDTLARALLRGDLPSGLSRKVREWLQR